MHDRRVFTLPPPVRFCIPLKTSILALCTLLIAGCLDPDDPLPPPERDRDVFRCEVYPVLLRDCGFAGCHGDGGRFFQVYGPGRVRLDPAVGIFGPPTPEELDMTFERSRSMLESTPPFESSLLVRKPLDAAAGGAGHEGTDPLGRDVYASEDDPRWQVLARWAAGEDGVRDCE